MHDGFKIHKFLLWASLDRAGQSRDSRDCPTASSAQKQVFVWRERGSLAEGACRLQEAIDIVASEVAGVGDNGIEFISGQPDTILKAQDVIATARESRQTK